jgi:hypothetical protein
MKYILLIVSLLISHHSWANETTDQWGSWGSPPEQFSRQLDNGIGLGKSNIYGSGIAGTDENLLHELDRSSLLDYQQKELSITAAAAENSTSKLTDIESPENSLSLTDSIDKEDIVTNPTTDFTYSVDPSTIVTIDLSNIQQEISYSEESIDWAQAIEDGGITINGIEYTLQELKDGLITFEVNEPSIPSFVPDTIETDNARTR